MKKRKLYTIIGITVGLLILITIPAVILSLHFLGGNDALGAGPKLVIDHDAGADDSMAIFMALLSEDYLQGPPVIGLTTTHGNVDETQSFINTQRILDIANRREVPIYRGSNFSLVYTYPTDHFFGSDGLGDLDDVEYQALEAEPHHAAIALIELSKKYEGELVVVALGALTNIALAAKLDPYFIGRLLQLYVGSGNVYSAEHPDAEFNALIDVEAYHIVADNSIPERVTIVPFSRIKDSIYTITRDWRENVLGATPTEIMRQQNLFERISIVTTDTWTLLDPAVMALVLDDHMVESTLYSENSIILCGDQRGINTNNLSSTEVNVKMINSVNHETYKELLITIFSSELLN